MKRLGILVILAALMIPCTAAAQAGGAVQCSVPPIVIDDSLEAAQRVNAIIDALKNYANHVPPLKSALNNRYEICFEMEGALEIDQNVANQVGGFEGYFKFVAEKYQKRDVYLSGLKLKRGADLQASEALLNVENHGEGKILIDGLEFDNVKKGISVFGKGYVEIRNSRFTGDGKTDDCIRIRTDGVLMDNVEATNCAEGISVEANNVKIMKSNIHNNKIGIHVLNGYSATDIEKSVIYDNYDPSLDIAKRLHGILIDEGIIRDLRFFTFASGDIIQFDPDEVAFNPKYILIPEEQLQNGKIELFLTEKDDCNLAVVSRDQACGIFDDGGICTIDAMVLNDEKVVKCSLPEGARNKELVAMFTSATLGTTPISQKFQSGGDLIAIIQSPFDIPTTEGGGVAAAGGGVGGSSSTDIQDDSDIVVDDPIIDFADERAGLSSGGIGDSDGDGDGGTGALCTLYALNDNHGITSAGIGAIWILLALAGLGSMRVVCVRKRDKTIDYRP